MPFLLTILVKITLLAIPSPVYFSMKPTIAQSKRFKKTLEKSLEFDSQRFFDKTYLGLIGKIGLGSFSKNTIYSFDFPV